MRRICAVVCGNGLGHLRRTLQVISALTREDRGLRSTVICGSWQLEALAHWSVLQALRENEGVNFQCLELYPRWCGERDYFRDDRLLTWHEQLKPVGLDAYDLVLSDNLVEPLIYESRTILMGSFLWHDIYFAHFSEEPVVQEYWTRCVDLLKDRSPIMVSNRYFVMPAVRDQTRAIEVGMLPSAMKGFSDHGHEGLGILFVGGSVPAVTESMECYLRKISAAEQRPDGLRLYVDRSLARSLSASDAFVAFDYDRDDFMQVDAVVARPGLGIITDCVTTGKPLFCLHEPNFEMEHNTRTLERLGLGWRLPPGGDWIGQVRSFFADPLARSHYRDRLSKIDKCGLEQTVEILIEHLDYLSRPRPAVP